MKYSKSELQKIRWRSARRGMMEVDIILTSFFDKSFLKLSDAEQENFLRVLEQSDTVLWDWFFTDAKPKDPGLRKLVARIRSQAV